MTSTKKRSKNNNSDGAVVSKKKKKKKPASIHNDRLDPKSRGIHPDAIRFEPNSVSGRATCVHCRHKIALGSARWGIKYAGNPLSTNVIPLYGSHPMYMWCHDTCGLLGFCRLSTNMPEAARTCHACQDTPSNEGVRLVCGGPNKNNKIQLHAFHIQCYLKAMTSNSDDDVKNSVRDPTKITAATADDWNGLQLLSWKDLTSEEQEHLQREWSEYSTK